MGLEELTFGKQIIAVVCNQFGDTGKGKISDYFATYWADVCSRGTGGNNAGHTTVVNGVKRVFHLLPCGIVHDSRGVINVLGNGMVINLEVLNHELDQLDSGNMTYNNLMVSEDAHVILPFHIDIDKALNQSQLNGGIGATGRGIGPCYEDKIGRRGIMIRDLFDRDKLFRKLIKSMNHHEYENIPVDDMISYLMPLADRIRPFIRNTINEMHDLVRQGKKISIEGAQGNNLSIEFGTYPYVTGSDCSVNGTAAGVGLSARAIDLCLGVVKYPFMTRVGGGPFPTEIGGKRAEEYCQDESHVLERELIDNQIPFEKLNGKIKYDYNNKKILEMMGSNDELTQNIGLRLRANEYGATTGRPRRVGWVDAVSARFAVGINGPDMVLTKVDCLESASGFKICYDYDGTNVFSRDPDHLRKVTPGYRDYGCYDKIGEVNDFNDLPTSLRTSIDDFERFTHGHVRVVSYGAERDATLVR